MQWRHFYWEPSSISSSIRSLSFLWIKENGLAAEFLDQDYEHTAEILQRIYLSTNVMQQGIIAQEQVLKKIAEEGSSIILGRAADYVLREQPDLIRIF